MGQVSSKLRRTENGFSWWCPACDEMHPLPDGWTFDGNVETPTFTPSFKHTWSHAGEPRCCHYIVTAGKVAYQSDCTHGRKGETITMPDLPLEYRDSPDEVTP